MLASTHPEKLAHFYADAFYARYEPGLDGFHWRVLREPSLELDIYRPSQWHKFGTRSRIFAPCLRFTPSDRPDVVLHCQLDRLLGHGAFLVEPASQESFGTEAWITDPEGNPILLVAPRTLAHKIP